MVAWVLRDRNPNCLGHGSPAAGGHLLARLSSRREHEAVAEGMDVKSWWVTLIFQVVVAGILVALVSFLIRGSVNKRAAARR